MSPGAHVNRIDAIDQFRAAWCAFGDELGQALAGAQTELQRFVEWLEHDQVAYWKQEIRVREAALAEAKSDLHRCLAATIDPNRTPSCYQEKKIVARAKERLEEAHEKLEAVRRWIPLVHQAVFEYRRRVEPLDSALATLVPEGKRYLEQAARRLHAYLEVELASPPPLPGAEAACRETGDSSVPATRGPDGESVEKRKPEAEIPPEQAVQTDQPASQGAAASDLPSSIAPPEGGEGQGLR